MSIAPDGIERGVATAAAPAVGGFESIYREHAGRVYAVCLRLTADPTRAEEATQETFVRAWRRLGSFRGDAALGTWLHRIAVNVSLGRARSRRRRERLVGPASPPEVPDRPPAAAGDGARAVDLERAVRALPERARQVFVLHDVEGYGHAEVAERLGVSTGTSKSQLHRARRLLREALER